MRGLERSAARALRAAGDCPGCGIPVLPGQPVLNVHMGSIQDEEGMTDLLPAFHKTCGAAHLINQGRAKTEAQRSREPLLERKAS